MPVRYILFLLYCAEIMLLIFLTCFKTITSYLHLQLLGQIIHCNVIHVIAPKISVCMHFQINLINTVDLYIQQFITHTHTPFNLKCNYYILHPYPFLITYRGPICCLWSLEFISLDVLPQSVGDTSHAIPSSQTGAPSWTARLSPGMWPDGLQI